ncbi:head GIN domain-containing protein [candidate division KSB1 bacterium]
MKSKILISPVMILIISTMFLFNCQAKEKDLWQGNITSNSIIKQERKVSSFDKLKIGSALDIVLSQGDKEMVVVEAPENIIEKIITEVRGSELVIRVQQHTKNLNNVKITIFFKDLEAMNISGAVDVENEGTMKFQKLEMSISGASNVDFKMNVDKLALIISGASDLTLIGTAESAKIEVSGASETKGLDFIIQDAMVEASGASEVSINAKESLAVEISGASTVTYKEGPPVFKSHVTGGGSLRKI